MELEGLAGIELDIQLTKDKELVVIHDERVDRTTEGIGFVREYTLSELKKLHIYADINPSQSIPTMDEILCLLGERLKTGMRLNIELKTEVYSYPGIEEKIVELVHRRGFEKSIIYSSFYAKSLEKIHQLDKDAQIGILDNKVSDCMYKMKGCDGINALHPFWKGLDLPAKDIAGYDVRAWFGGHLYPEKPTGSKLNIRVLEMQGITDIFLNEPEKYLE